jgi:general secretion pathway protein G
MSGSRVARGFTLIELIVTLGLVSVLAAGMLPLYEVTSTRMKEAELRSALRTIRNALDAYKAAADRGLFPVAAGESGYPPSLTVLTEGVELGVKNATTLDGRSAPQRMVFLRRLPRDPFFADATVAAEQTWDTRAYGTPSSAPAAGADVYDVMSKSVRAGLDGQPYNTW